MTPKEQDAFRMIEGGLELLQKAVEAGDPHAELKLRVADLIRDIKAIAWPDLKNGPDVHAQRYRRHPHRSHLGSAFCPKCSRS